MQISLKHIILATLALLLIFAIWDSSRETSVQVYQDEQEKEMVSPKKQTPSKTSSKGSASKGSTKGSGSSKNTPSKGTPTKAKVTPAPEVEAVEVDDGTPAPARVPLVLVMVTTNRTRPDGSSGSTLTDTLTNMMENITPAEKKVSKFLVINNQIPYTAHDQIEEAAGAYKADIKSGWMKLLENPHTDYAKKLHLDNMRMSHGDPVPRKVWRAKEMLDYAYALETAEPLGQYVLFLEDDIQFASRFITRILHVLTEAPLKEADYAFLSLFTPHDDKYAENIGYRKLECCTQALVWKHNKIADVVKFTREEYDQNPLDWAMSDYLGKRETEVYFSIPDMIQHVGGASSFGMGFGGALHYSKTFDPEPQFKDYAVDYSALYDDDAKAAKYYNDRQFTLTKKNKSKSRDAEVQEGVEENM